MIILFLRYLQGIVNSCFQSTWGHVLELQVGHASLEDGDQVDQTMSFARKHSP